MSAVGRSLSDAGKSRTETDEFGRNQLFSSASSCKHISIEIAEYGPYLDKFLSAIVNVSGPLLVERTDLVDSGSIASLASSRDAIEIGEFTCKILDALRSIDGVESINARVQIRTLMHLLAENEVRLLGKTIERGRPNADLMDDKEAIK